MNKPIFSRGREKILECFYRNKSRELYFSEILRETGLTQNTTLHHLKSLQQNGLILSTKKIGNTFYRINSRNPQVFSLLSYFDYKRFNELTNERKRAIAEFLDRIETKPLIALVFGSTAKKTYKPRSDIDMLLVFNKKEMKQDKTKKEVEAITGVDVQPFTIDFDYFKEQLLRHEDNVIMHAIKTGFVMSGYYFFYKEVLK